MIRQNKQFFHQWNTVIALMLLSSSILLWMNRIIICLIHITANIILIRFTDKIKNMYSVNLVLSKVTDVPDDKDFILKLSNSCLHL